MYKRYIKPCKAKALQGIQQKGWCYNVHYNIRA